MKRGYLLSKTICVNKNIKSQWFLKTFILVFFLIACVGAVQAQYCMPEDTIACLDGDQYQAFITTGGLTNINHEPGDTCEGDAGGYASFSGPLLSCSGMHGNTISFSILNDTAYPEGYAIWVDWNQDNVFEPSEQVFATSDSLAMDSTAIDSFVIPSNALIGNTVLRIRCAYGVSGTLMDPCTPYNYGITFDFPFSVLNTQPVFTGGSPQSLMVCENGVADISSLLAVNDADSGQTEIWSAFSAPSNGTLVVADTIASTGSTLTPSGLSYSPAPGYAGLDSFSVEVNDSNGGIAFTTIYVTVNPLPLAGTVFGGLSVCMGSSTLYSDTSYANGSGTWTSDNTSAATVDPFGNVYGVSAGVADIIFTVTSGFTPGCGSVSTSATIFVNPLPAPITGAGSICAGATTALTEDSTGGTWSSSNSLVASVDGSGTLFGISAGIDTIGYTSDSGCSVSFMETVNPLPNVNPVTIPAVCNTSITAIVYFRGAVPGTIFNWTATGAGIGIPGRGVDSIGSFIALNPSDTIESAAIMVIPMANGCTGIASSFTMSVNPTPTVNPIMSPAAVCNGASITPVDFAGSAVSGTVYNWVNNDTTIGLAATGAGNISTFTATDTTDTVTTGVITVTPVANSCAGAVQTFTITVYPTPSVAGSSNQTVCNGSATTAISFTGPVAGSSFSWTNSTGGSGISRSGTGNIPSFTAVNDSAYAITDTIIVTASANGCIGHSNTFEIQVNPTPKLSSLLVLPAICDNVPFTYTPESATSGTTYTWNRGTIAGISNGAKTGTGSVSDTLDNTATHPIGVTYVYTLSASSCTHTESVTVTVNPLPTLSTTLTPSAVCDSMPFIYGPASVVAGTSFTWSRAVIFGISNLEGSGADTINETLVNTINTPITVVYVDTLKANGCSNIQNIRVTVNPEPKLTTTTTAPSICDSTLFTYVPSSTIESTTFTWSRAVVTGISNPAASGGDTISEVLVNTTANPVNVVYVDSMTAFGCVYTEDVNVTVNPRPTLTSSLTPPGLCDSATFDYTPNSATTGATFAWDRPFVLGIALDSAHGTGTVDERLINSSNSNLDVTYNYTITANGCSFNQSVVVIVHPTPTMLVSSVGETVCSGTDFIYVPQDSGLVFGTSYSWVRPMVPGILPATNFSDSANSPINETLTDTALVPIVTSYVFRLTANGCSHVQTVNVTVNPAPAAVQITTHPPSSLCSNTLFQNFGTSTPPPAGQAYSWSAVNATIWAEGHGGQYVLVSFPSEGNAVITLNSNLAGVACEANNSYTVNVSGSMSTTPEVIYYNGQFICLQGNMDSYQWGSDDAYTLDSTIAEGQVNQVYFISNPDITSTYYWVITTLNGCMQKSYFNAPTAITNVNTGGQAEIKVYPNPTSNFINVNINTTEAGRIEVHVLNMMGQELKTTEAIDHKARIDVADLPSGCYLIDCYREGVKIGATRFIKN